MIIQWIQRSVAVVVLAFGFSALASETWNVDASHATARFKVTHMMLSKVSGEITGVTGTFKIDPKDITKLTAEVTLDPKTISTHNAKRDDHLKNADFLDVTAHPTISFKSTKVVKKGKDTFDMTGDLTLHGVTKPVTLKEAKLTAPQKNPFGAGQKRAFSGKTTINRKDFGLVWNKTMDGGGVVVGDTVEIEVEAELDSTEKAAEKKG